MVFGPSGSDGISDPMPSEGGRVPKNRARAAGVVKIGLYGGV
ncbi:hypothetical protein NMB9615945_1727 [Neisseria meningitidis 961-5945]|nr:hypothetical protein NMB9615945_1766 [Neisseria meningitidis 961-5945]EGC64152.1 hypothetical protein NMB9615945_1727 [Neisseria meningitidis 961-5945]